jgi:predicted membrane protein
VAGGLEKMSGRVIIGSLIILIGLGFLFDLNVFRFLIPALLIFFGLRIIFGQRSGFGSLNKSVSKEDEIKRVMIFSGINQKSTAENFRKAELAAIFGGGDLDLSQVKTKTKTVELDLVAVFGGVKVRIPENWSVASEGVGILGGFDDKTSSVIKANVKCQIKGVAIFGGVEVVN